jgi:hypothetical protein
VSKKPALVRRLGFVVVSLHPNNPNAPMGTVGGKGPLYVRKTAEIFPTLGKANWAINHTADYWRRMAEREGHARGWFTEARHFAVIPVGERS